ncbi:MAG: hypothetical protein L6420_01120 [Elusimicrobia bacterium]|nr:hypothetical protein [Elusimicrobiota bacterium]
MHILLLTRRKIKKLVSFLTAFFLFSTLFSFAQEFSQNIPDSIYNTKNLSIPFPQADKIDMPCGKQLEFLHSVDSDKTTSSMPIEANFLNNDTMAPDITSDPKDIEEVFLSEKKILKSVSYEEISDDNKKELLKDAVRLAKSILKSADKMSVGKLNKNIQEVLSAFSLDRIAYPESEKTFRLCKKNLM